MIDDIIVIIMAYMGDIVVPKMVKFNNLGYIIVRFIQDNCSFSYKLRSNNKEELVRRVSDILFSLNAEEKKDVLKEVLSVKEEGIPISAFKARLSCLEIVVKYLKENMDMSFKEISELLNRRLSTLYNTYNNSKIKFKSSLNVFDKSIVIPLSIFSDRNYSMLESLVAYLVNEGYSLVKISSLLGKKYNTIKTVYRRHKIKNV